MKTLILYHASCADGFAAAYVAWTRFGTAPGVTYKAIQYGEELPSTDLVHGCDVYVLDFSYTHAECVELLNRGAGHITLLDHHKTAADKWEGLLDNSGVYLTRDMTIRFDMHRSGAWMTWDFFNPDSTCTRPLLVEHIGDRDLWHFANKHTKAFCAGLSAKPQSFDVWHEIATDTHAYTATVAAGYAILGFQQSQIDKATNGELKIVRLLDVPGLATNATNNISEIGNAIAKRSGTYSLSFFIKDNEAICSLRSLAPFDCTPIAKHYGGGGHAQACGFKLPVQQFFTEVWA